MFSRNGWACAVDGKVVAVTGGARGIGLAIATMLRRHGARVAIGDLDELAARSAAEGVGISCVSRLDVTDVESFEAFLDATEQELGPIDVLINNAGVIAVGPAIDEPDDVTERVLRINAYGVMIGTKLAARRMRARGRGHIINIASTSSLMPVPGIATYSATKHAVLGYTDAVRLENRGTGIRFSTVMPSLTNTEMISGVGRARGFSNLEPDDVAGAVCALIARPKNRVIVPATFAVVALSPRRFLPQRVYEAIERMLGAERVFQGDVDFARRTAYRSRTDTP